MYYEEKVIHGILYRRSSPDAKFEPFSQHELTELILREREEHKAKVRKLEEEHGVF